MRDFCQHAIARIADYWYYELGLHPSRGDWRLFGNPFNGPRCLVLSFVVNAKYFSQISKMENALSIAIGLDGEKSVRIARGIKGSITIEIPKPNGHYNVGIQQLPRSRGLKATVGLKMQEGIASIDFSYPITPHLLIPGATGTGKTNAQKLMFYDIASANDPEDAQFVLIDTRKRGIDWKPMSASSHLAHPVVTDENEAIRSLMWGASEIDRRSQDNIVIPRIFFQIDEVQSLLQSKDATRLITDIASAGRQFGIHLIIGTQDPKSDNIGNLTLKRQMARLVGKVDDGTAAHVATGKRGTGAELLSGPGDMILVTDKIFRVATALITDDDIAELPQGNIGHLDLSSYEDANLIPTKKGRPPDPLDYALVGKLIGLLATSPGLSNSTLASKVGVYIGKLDRHLTVAREILSSMTDYRIMKSEN